MDFPGGWMVKTLPSDAGDTDLSPGQRTRIPHAMWNNKWCWKTWMCVCVCLCVCVCVCVCTCACVHRHTHMLSCVWLFETPWTVAHQAPLCLEFSKQEYWSVLPFPPPAALSDPGIKPASPASAGGFFATWVSWEAQETWIPLCK